ncbi:hypothetical protein N0B16_12625 [Chryseobacterium sp. GMJ5]|uniref:Lipoprotein n=1 Tax=Chryseobacterium gilvum TaxID=2976534 RepID=A0ABT2VZV8_9FLAO|nr:hypothetical protein [Chryseobacterium gilvum]MCU7615285.1 hypothetical protein [Chryseobacterium gilvum]
MSRNILNILALFLIIINLSCIKKSNEISKSLSSGFSDSVRLSKARKFDFQYDGLTPQASYFLGCKLKFLEIEHHGELTTIKEQIIFEDDSIRTLYSISETYGENSERGGRNWDEKTNAILIKDYKNKTSKTYRNDWLTKVEKITKSSKLEKEFLYRVKMYTEKEYNCGK